MRAYLAFPYSSNDKELEERRLATSIDASRFLMEKGFIVHNPLCATLPLSTDDNKYDNGFWVGKVDDSYIRFWAEVLIVLQIPGWDESKGVKAEMRIAMLSGKPILYLDPSKNIRF